MSPVCLDCFDAKSGYLSCSSRRLCIGRIPVPITYRFAFFACGCLPRPSPRHIWQEGGPRRTTVLELRFEALEDDAGLRPPALV